MAQFTETFAGNTAGTLVPSGFESIWAGNLMGGIRVDNPYAVVLPSGLEYALYGSTQARRAICHTGTGNVADAELYTFSLLNYGCSGLVLRASGSVGNESAYLLNGDISATYLRLFRLAGGSLTTIGSWNASSLWGNVVGMRFRVAGSAVKARIWAAYEPEPAIWQIEVSDTVISAGGKLGLYHYDNTSSRASRWSFLNIGTGSDYAPAFTGAYGDVTLRGMMVSCATNGVIGQQTTTAARAAVGAIT